MTVPEDAPKLRDEEVLPLMHTLELDRTSSSGSMSKVQRLPFLKRIKAQLSNFTPELLAIALVYFVQGILKLSSLAVTFFMKDTLKMEPTQMALADTITAVPWTIKPLYGFITDSCPIRGMRRRPYLIMSGLLGSVAWLCMAGFASSVFSTVACITLASLSTAFSDVVADSIVVQLARASPGATEGALQSMCWSSHAFGRLITAYLSGWLVGRVGPRPVFVATASFPLIVCASSCLIKEHPRDSSSNSGGSSGSSRPAVSSTEDRELPDQEQEQQRLLLPVSTSAVAAAAAAGGTPTGAGGSASAALLPTARASVSAHAGVSGVNEGVDVGFVKKHSSSFSDVEMLQMGDAHTFKSQESEGGASEHQVVLTQHQIHQGQLVHKQRGHHPPSTQQQQQQWHQQPQGWAAAAAGTDYSGGGGSSRAAAPNGTSAFASAAYGAAASSFDIMGDGTGSGSSSSSKDRQQGQQQQQHWRLLLANMMTSVKLFWGAIKQPHMLRPVMFLFLWQAMPQPDSAMFYFKTNKLGFDAEFFGRVKLVAALADLVGLAVYNAFLKSARLRPMLLCGSILGCLVGLTPLLLVEGINRKLGISDRLFALVDSALLASIGQVLMMPTLVLSARLCPEGVEATLYACLMSLNNAAAGASVALGAVMTKLFGITSTNFAHLSALLFTCNVISLLPLPLVRWVPDESPKNAAAAAAVAAAEAAAAAERGASGKGSPEEERQLHDGVGHV